MASVPAERLATIVPLPAADGDYRVLVDVLREMTRAPDLPGAFSATAQGLAELVRLDWMGLVLRDERDGTLHLHMSLTGRPDWLAVSQPVLSPPPEVSDWVLPSSFRSLSPGSTPVGARHSAWPFPRDLVALVAAPMPSTPRGSRRTQDRQDPRGTLLLGRSRGQGFEPGTLPMLDAVAAQLSVIVERIEWLQRFRTANSELTARVQSLEQGSGRRKADDASLPAATAPVEPLVADPRWLAADPAGREAMEIIDRAAPTDLSVLLSGESGAGKELLARALHRLSARARAPFIAVNVATLTVELAGSELFGHVPGAFTGAQGVRKGLIDEAEGGTLFLDEVGDMPTNVQPALLRFLEDGLVRPIGGNRTHHVDVRTVSATNHDLQADVVAGRFREDLFHRLAGVEVRLPPLRERPADLRELAAYFLQEGSGGRYKALPDPWWPALRAYPWPGNVRELRNAMRAVAGLSRGDEPEARFLPAPVRDAVLGRTATPSRGEFEGWSLSEVEREVVRRAMIRWEGHRGRAAQELGLSARTLYDKLKRFGLDGD